MLTSQRHHKTRINSLEVFLVGLEHTVEPGKEFLGAVVAGEGGVNSKDGSKKTTEMDKSIFERIAPRPRPPMQDHRDAVVLGHQPDVLGPGDGPKDGSLLAWGHGKAYSARV